MPIDQDIFRSPASKGNVAGLALETFIALRHLSYAIEKVSAKLQIDVSAELERVQAQIEALDRRFETLSGWTEE